MAVSRAMTQAFKITLDFRVSPVYVLTVEGILHMVEDNVGLQVTNVKETDSGDYLDEEEIIDFLNNNYESLLENLHKQLHVPAGETKH